MDCPMCRPVDEFLIIYCWSYHILYLRVLGVCDGDKLNANDSLFGIFCSLSLFLSCSGGFFRSESEDFFVWQTAAGNPYTDRDLWMKLKGNWSGWQLLFITLSYHIAGCWYLCAGDFLIRAYHPERMTCNTYHIVEHCDPCMHVIWVWKASEIVGHNIARFEIDVCMYTDVRDIWRILSYASYMFDGLKSLNYDASRNVPLLWIFQCFLLFLCSISSVAVFKSIPHTIQINEPLWTSKCGVGLPLW